MKQLVVNADDLGICCATNNAIDRAFREGILTSASLMANGPAFQHAVENVVRSNADLGIGLHLCLTSGRSLLSSNEIPFLVDRFGRFHRGFLSLLRMVRTHRAAVLEQIEREFEAQFIRLQQADILIDHVDSHRHIHMIPGIFTLVRELSRRYRCPVIRMSDEPLPRMQAYLSANGLRAVAVNMPKKVIFSSMARINRTHAGFPTTTNQTRGILFSGMMDRGALRESMRAVPEGLTEVVTHPGSEHPTLSPDLSPIDHSFLTSPNRHAELRALLDPTVRESCERLGITLLRFRDVHPVPSDCAVRAGTLS